MGCGAREVTLEVFESYLKKLLHMIDKLPSQDKDKAVMILKNSANQYYNLTLGQPLEYYHAPEPVASYQPSQLLETNTAAAAQQYETQAASKAKLESEAILAELSDLGANGQLNCLNEDNNVEQESWDRHFESHGDLETITSASTNITPKCALCSKLFNVPSEVTKHYQPVSCIGCKKELCNYEIFNIHYHSCKGIKHYQAKVKTHLNTKKQQDGNASKVSSHKKQTYKCPECSKIFITAFQLNKHMKGHSDNNCDKCDAKFAKRRQLVLHLKTVHYISTAEKYYLCKYCPRKFVKKPSLWSHYSEHAKGSQVVCLKCGKMLEDEDALSQHMEDHKASARHTCPKCGDFFVRKQQYLSHLAGHDKYNCKTCGKDFSSKKKLKIHRNSEHDSNSSNVSKPKVEKLLATTKNPNFTCVVCLQNYKNETLFKAHDCSKDSKKSEKKKTLAKDVTIKLAPSKFKCRFCEFEHKKSSAVVRHARTHRNRKRFVCELCGSSFNAHYTLKEHRIYVHNDVRNFQCTKCDKTFKAKNALIRHEQVHSDKRPFSCHCGQMFKRSSHLKRHLATSHKGESLPPAAPAPVSTSSDQFPPDKLWTNQRPAFSHVSDNQPIPASVALDVVTSLDLNMRHLETKEGQEKEVKVKHEKERYGVRDGGSREMYHGYGQHTNTRYYPHSPHDHDKLYLPPPNTQEKMYVSPGSDGRNYSLDHDRNYREADQPHGYSDSGPADLTMARPGQTSVQRMSQQQEHRSQHRYSSGGHYSSSRSSYHHLPSAHSYSLRLGDYPRQSGHHHNTGTLSQSLRTIDPALEPGHTLDDPYISYRHQSTSASHYYDSIDSYVPGHPRDNIQEISQSCDKKKYYKSDKYYPREHHPDPERDEGGLLPPLLALAPHHESHSSQSQHSILPRDWPASQSEARAQSHPSQSSGQHPPSPNYLCSTQSQEQLASQYIQDGSLDYNNISEY